MRRLVLASALFLAYSSVAEAQPTVTAPSTVVPSGGSVAVTVSGTAGENFAVIASITNGGFSFGGTALNVGADVAILAVGVLNGTGNASVTVTPPFPARDRYYVQAVTSASPAFAPLAASNSLALLNRQEAVLYLSMGGGVNANGTSFALSPGAIAARTGAGVYQVTFGGQFGTNVIPNITSFCGLSPTGIVANNAGFTVTFASDCGFFFTATPIRR